MLHKLFIPRIGKIYQLKNDKKYSKTLNLILMTFLSDIWLLISHNMMIFYQKRSACSPVSLRDFLIAVLIDN